MSDGPAIGVIELRSIARGHLALDAACKRAVVHVVCAEVVSPGKFWFALRGGEAEVDEALLAAIDRAQDSRIDHVLLPHAHDGVLTTIAGGSHDRVELDAVACVETGSICATLRALDASLKAADVRVVECRLARGMGGKGYYVLSGALEDIEAASLAGLEAAGSDWVVGHEVVPRPDAGMHGALRTGR